ncbi:CAP domain-containing protein, partial [Streptomyces cacaoi]
TRELRHRRIRRHRRAVTAAAVLLLPLGVLGGMTLLPDGADEETKVATRPASPLPTTEPPSSTAPSPDEKTHKPSKPPEKKKDSEPSKRPSPTHTTARPTPTQRPSAPASRPAAPDGPDSGGGSGGLAQQVTRLANAERAKAGCGPLSLNDKLSTAGLRHSSAMKDRGFFDHTDPDGDGPGERITAAGYDWSTYGENIARGQRTPEQVMDSWMKSPGHRANILNCSFKEIGVGRQDGSGGPWWTQVFGAR